MEEALSSTNLETPDSWSRRRTRFGKYRREDARTKQQPVHLTSRAALPRLECMQKSTPARPSVRPIAWAKSVFSVGGWIAPADRQGGSSPVRPVRTVLFVSLPRRNPVCVQLPCSLDRNAQRASVLT